jgi:hypothetical protein
MLAGVARWRRTRLTVPTASVSSDVASAPSGIHRSSAAISACFARCGATSEAWPVRMFTTPPGRSLVARHSENVMAVRGSSSLASTTQTLPDTITGKIAVTSPSSDGRAGATTATTPMGSGTVKLKCGPATGFELASRLWYLSLQPANEMTRSIARSTSVTAASRSPPSERWISPASSPARPSMTSASR